MKKYIEGDLLELYAERLRTTNKRTADLKFIRDVILLFRPGIIRPFQLFPFINSPIMFNNYFKTGIRNLLKYKTFSFINVFGLAIAMSVCMLVILMLSDQYAYDQFHSRKDRIFRILSGRPYSSMPFASTPPELERTLEEDYPAIEKATHLIMGVGGEATSTVSTAEMRGFFADEHFLEVFDFELAQGNAGKALGTPNSLVITTEISKKLFGNENPLGQTVGFTDRGLHYLKSGKDSQPVDWGTFTITGVIADRNFRSHLRFDVLMSSSTRKILASDGKINENNDGWDKAFTYVLLRQEKNTNDLNSALSDLFNRKYSHSEHLKDFSLAGQPLTEITPGIMVNQPPSFQLPVEAYWFLGSIALAIMLSACLNYTNLSTARALTRAKEIGVRKVTGAHRRNLIVQFLCESVLTSMLALLLAMVLLVFMRTAFTHLWLNQYLSFELESNLSVYVIFCGFALVLGLLAGLYPAVRLSAFQPMKAIKNQDLIPSTKLGLRKVLSVGQFTISLFFIITSILVYTQFRYFMNFEYGFNPKGIVNIELQGNNFNRVHDAFGSLHGVATVSASEYIPGTGRTSGMELNKRDTDEPVGLRFLSADENFIRNLGLTLIAGRNMPETMDSAGRYILVNEMAVKALGFDTPEEIVGQVLTQTWNREALEVAGVVEDFWLKLPVGGDKLEPAFIRNDPGRYSFVNVKISASDIPATIKLLEEKWKSVDPVHPFKYRFYEEELASTHAGIFDVVSIVGFLAFVAITIACLGMLGMATYTAERKRKEVGIRKVLGAESFRIALMLSRDFVTILAASICIGAPLSWIINNAWLQNFANRAEFGFTTVCIGTLILVTLGLVTIGSQTIRVSKTNPVDSLKME